MALESRGPAFGAVAPVRPWWTGAKPIARSHEVDGDRRRDRAGQRPTCGELEERGLENLRLADAAIR